MKRVDLPISKSVANRWLICRAMQGDDMQSIVSSAIYPSWPDDVQIMASALAKMQHADECIVDVDNCGTAMRFLTAYAATQVGKTITLTGCERMCTARPIGALVLALRSLGADITYLGKEGYPPLLIHGRNLNLEQTVSMDEVESTQFISALLLIGARVRTCVRSPYIDMTRAVMSSPEALHPHGIPSVATRHRDWSAAAFWYERVALGLETEVFFPGLSLHSLQGDKLAADYFRQLGVLTQEDSDGIRIYANRSASAPFIDGVETEDLFFDLTNAPDLYPALLLTCHLLHVQPRWVLPDNLHIKESDRIEVMRMNISRLDCSLRSADHPFIATTCHDHRIAMAFMAAGYAVDDPHCVTKSYPDFTRQLA